MRQDFEHEFTESMDAIRFSEDAKEQLVQILLERSAHQSRPKPGRRKLLFIALAAALVLVTFTGAAVFTRWSKSMDAQYNATQHQKAQAEKAGLSSMLETTAAEGDILSVTDQGVTITAVQSMVDKYGARLIFRINGFELPEGEKPAIELANREPIRGAHSVAMPVQFYDGTRKNEKNAQVYWDGSPLQYDSEGYPILYYVAEDGSLEFTLTLVATDSPVGKEVTVQFSSIGTATAPSMVRGNWELKWTLSGTPDIRHEKQEQIIGDTGLTLLESEISPISVCALLLLDNSDGHIQLYEVNDPAQREATKKIDSLFIGYRTRNGVIHTNFSDSGSRITTFSNIGSQMTYPEYQEVTLYDQNILYFVYRPVSSLLSPEDVDALVFLKSNPENKELWELTEDDLYIVPIS